MEPQVSTRLAPVIDRGGAWVVIGGAEYQVPPLNFASLRRFLPVLRTLGQLPLDEQFSKTVELVHAALKRAYPDLTQEHLEEELDLGNFRAVMAGVMAASGLARTEPGGEGSPAEGAPPLTGTASTSPSS